ncbi:hypothetical protein N0V88_007019 [Collariella sp. IMI 366227]|nr:hypothetical protein N0V88_007019 [Collariella sp. IMI 366227]
MGDYLNQPQVQYLVPDTSFQAAQPPQYEIQGREISMDEIMSMGDEDLYPSTFPINIPASTPVIASSNSTIPGFQSSISLCNSMMNDGASISGQFSEMVRIQSHQSARNHLMQENFVSTPMSAHPSSLGKRRLETAGFTMPPPDSFPDAFSSSTPAGLVMSQHQHPMERSVSQQSIQSASSAAAPPYESFEFNSPFLAQHLSMERSSSNNSVKSNASLSLRAKETLSRQNNAAKSRLLQPKPAAGTEDPESSEGTTGTDGKAVIAKAKYERPKHPKVKCNQCSEHPDGFRGEHELRRHTEAKHKSLVKKWICRDPDDANIPHSENVVKPLRDCKQCSQGKQYGAYYNAAAHLRRTHFKLKPPRGAAKGGQAKGEEEKEKRGGKGGGDWPPMDELKCWMEEIMVNLDEAGTLVPIGAELDPEEFENESPVVQATPPLLMGADNMDMTVFAGLGGGFSQSIDLPTSFPGGLDTQLNDIYAFNGSLYQTPALDYNDLFQQDSPPSRRVALNNHGYPASISSTGTVIQGQGAMFTDQLLSPVTQIMSPTDQFLSPSLVKGEPDDLGEMPFDLTFITPGQ